MHNWGYIFVGADAQLCQWSCSALESAIYTLPNQGRRDSHRVPISGKYYVYPLPSTLNCNGTVSAVRFCWRKSAHITTSTEEPVFRLLMLNQTGQFFNIAHIIPVHSRPTDQMCTCRSNKYVDYRCCNCSINITDQFHLPAPNFAFGIIPSSSVTLFAFTSRYKIQHYWQNTTTELWSPSEGNTISVASMRMLTDRAPILIQFLISKYI